MAQKTMVLSDLSGEIIQDDSDAVTIVVLDHPQVDQPVSLDATKAEVKSLGGSQEYVVLEVLSDGGDSKERVVLELAEFDKLFKKGDADEVLSQAPLYGRHEPAPAPAPARRGRPPASGTAKEKRNFKELPLAGLPHQGRVSDAEMKVVQANLEQVNRNRVAEGHAPIDPANGEDAEKYGFDQMPAADRPALSPEFKS